MRKLFTKTLSIAYVVVVLVLWVWVSVKGVQEILLCTYIYICIYICVYKYIILYIYIYMQMGLDFPPEITTREKFRSILPG